MIDVIPLSRTAPGMLSYRSKEDLPAGTVVRIAVRKTETQGIVLASVPVAEAKEMLKRADFSLSKSAVAKAGALPASLLRAAEKTARFHAASIGAVLSALFSEYVRLGVPLPMDALAEGASSSRTPIELPLAERRAAYGERIEAARAEGGTVLLVVPTLAELSYWRETLKEYAPLTLSGALSRARREKALEAAITHEGVVIVTPQFSWVPIQKLACIILDRISAGTYTLPKRPYLSVVCAAEALAAERAVPLVLGDFPLPLEYRPAHKAALTKTAAATLFDARRDPEDQEDSGPWKALPDPILEEIRDELANDGRVILLATRAGYAPAVVCRECGQAQTDDRGMPLMFSQKNGERIFITSDGASTIDAKRPCTRCESWNLLPLGVGIERVEEEARAAFPSVPLTVVSSELLSSAPKVRAALEEASVPGSILIGTEALLPWLYEHSAEPLPLGIIVSADSLLALPFWRARERFVRLAYFFRGACRAVRLITRHPEDTAVEAVTVPGSDAFWNEETTLRRALAYPPFGTIMTLSFEGPPAAVRSFAERICTSLEQYAPAELPARTNVMNASRATLVLHLPEGAWPDETLLNYVRALPPSVRVRIDPESLW